MTGLILDLGGLCYRSTASIRSMLLVEKTTPAGRLYSEHKIRGLCLAYTINVGIKVTTNSGLDSDWSKSELSVMPRRSQVAPRLNLPLCASHLMATSSRAAVSDIRSLLSLDNRLYQILSNITLLSAQPSLHLLPLMWYHSGWEPVATSC